LWSSLVALYWHALLLGEGRCVYSSPADEALPYFEQVRQAVFLNSQCFVSYSMVSSTFASIVHCLIRASQIVGGSD
jgi:hypothetical protein